VNEYERRSIIEEFDKDVPTFINDEEL